MADVIPGYGQSCPRCGREVHSIRVTRSRRRVHHVNKRVPACTLPNLTTEVADGRGR